MLELHDWILVELWIHLPLLTNVHASLVIAGGAWQAFEVEATSACRVNPLFADLPG